eukprot:scaffold27611_cov16-Tisochrysis_lutea.AAC.1
MPAPQCQHSDANTTMSAQQNQHHNVSTAMPAKWCQQMWRSQFCPQLGFVLKWSMCPAKAHRPFGPPFRALNGPGLGQGSKRKEVQWVEMFHPMKGHGA